MNPLLDRKAAPFPSTAELSLEPGVQRSGLRTREKLLYAATIFLSAFLLFEVQSIIAKIILPWLGGVAAVWSVCLLFFQSVLLLGYLYAHLLTRKFDARIQGGIHVCLLAASLLALPILPKDSWKPSGAGDPALRVLVLLTATVGLPYFLLSSTSPLLQAWYARSPSNATPYRFYALSNAGSMLALLGYPLAVEPFISRTHQAVAWSASYAGVTVLCGVVALSSRKDLRITASLKAPPAPNWQLQSLWLALAACGSALLLAITNHISQNIAAVPFLWIMPLSVYLLSFILCFEGHAWYRRGLFLKLLFVALGGMAYALSPTNSNSPPYVLIPIFVAGLFICCMVCHGELARLKPEASHLTAFYLMCSLGGALGASFVALLAPHLFSGYYELPIAMVVCARLVLITLRRDPESRFYRASWQPSWLGLVALVVALVASVGYSSYRQGAHRRLMLRNFYGVLRVTDSVMPRADDGKRASLPIEERRYRNLLNGTIDHGMQFLSPERQREPTSYYSTISGVGTLLKVAGKNPSLRVGVIGLGSGTIAAYGRPSDHYTFYEINPLVLRVAHEQFTFLRNSRATIDVQLGDARLSLEREPPQDFDVLAVDAFSGDSIPVHLLTREAFSQYFRHLRPDGVLAVHVSNKYLDLQPVVETAAASLNKQAVIIENDADKTQGIYASTWILLGNANSLLNDSRIIDAGDVLEGGGHSQLWTDDYSSLLPLLKR